MGDGHCLMSLAEHERAMPFWGTREQDIFIPNSGILTSKSLQKSSAIQEFSVILSLIIIAIKNYNYLIIRYNGTKI